VVTDDQNADIFLQAAQDGRLIPLTSYETSLALLEEDLEARPQALIPGTRFAMFSVGGGFVVVPAALAAQ
jgi:hypothetical protein